METPEEFCSRVPRELGLVDFNSFEARRHLAKRIAERDNAIRLALLDELEAPRSIGIMPYPMREWIAELRTKYSEPPKP